MEEVDYFPSRQCITPQSIMNKQLNHDLKVPGTCNWICLDKIRFLLPKCFINYMISLIFFSAILLYVFSKSIHLVSAAEKEQSHVGLPSLGSKATKSFSHFSK